MASTNPHLFRVIWRRRILLTLFAGLALYAIAAVPVDKWRSLLPSSVPLGPVRVVVRAFDAIGRPGQDVILRAKVQKDDAIGLCKGVPGVRVQFRLDDAEIGSARTGVEGQATLEWTPPSPGEFTLHASVDPTSTNTGASSTFLVGAYHPDDQFVVVAFDGTLTEKSGLKLPFERAHVPEPMADAVRVLTKISDRHHVLYLTGKDERSMQTVRDWLTEKGFPSGVALFRDYELVGPGLEDYKFHELQRLRADYPAIAIGVSNDFADARAYSRAGLRPIFLGSLESVDPPPGTSIAATWTEVEKLVLEP